MFRKCTLCKIMLQLQVVSRPHFTVVTNTFLFDFWTCSIILHIHNFPVVYLTSAASPALQHTVSITYIEAPHCVSFKNCSMSPRCCKFSTAALSKTTHNVELLYYHMYIEAPLCVSFMNCSMSPRCCKFSTAALQHSHKRHTKWSIYTITCI